MIKRNFKKGQTQNCANGNLHLTGEKKIRKGQKIKNNQ